MQYVDRFVYGALAVCLAAALSACNQSASQTPPQMPPPEVSALALQPRDIPITLQYGGRTEGVREVEVRPRVGGILLSWNYTEGSTVKTGQSLFTVDPVPYQTAVAKAEAPWWPTRCAGSRRADARSPWRGS